MASALLLLVSLLLAGAPRTQAPLRPDQLVHAPGFEELSARWRAAVEDLGVPGMAVVVVDGDQVIHLETFGLRNVGKNLPVTPEAIFYIASATKPYLAFAATQLAEEGRLELDAPVQRYLPRFRLADAQAPDGCRAREITLRDLLCHRPGIQNFPVVWLDACTGEISEKRYFHFLSAVEPTGVVTYSNVHFTLAGRVVEAVAGTGWRDVLAERLFAPAGMERTTGYADWMYAQEDVAIPTVWTGDGFEPASVRKTDATMHAAGGMGTSIGDLSRWLRIQLNGGKIDGARLISVAGLEETQAEQSRLPAIDGWLRKMEGFGLGWMRGEYRGHRYLQHGGGYIGSASHVSFLPELGLGVAVLANTDGPGQAICNIVSIDVLDHLLGDQSAYDPLPRFRDRGGVVEGPTEPNRARAEGALTLPPPAYAGTYADEHWATLEIALRDGHLVGHMGHVRFAFYTADGPDRFSIWARSSLEAEGAFETENGQVVAVSIDLAGHRVRFVR